MLNFKIERYGQSDHFSMQFKFCSDAGSLLVMGPGQNFWPRSGQIFVAQVGSGQPSLVWVWIWKFSPKNPKFFSFLTFGSKKCHRVGLKSTRVKAGSASYLVRVKSMLGSGQGPSLLSMMFSFKAFILISPLLCKRTHIPIISSSVLIQRGHHYDDSFAFHTYYQIFSFIFFSEHLTW